MTGDRAEAAEAHNDNSGDAFAVGGAGPSVLQRMQRGLERLYRVRTDLDVEAFVVDDSGRERSLAGTRNQPASARGTHRRPREQLLVAQGRADDELELALFVAPEALANLAAHDPGRELSAQNFEDFCLALEGVSHFIYVAWCAQAQRSVSALELELQAEVDKFAACWLLLGASAERAAPLRERLYHRIAFAADLSADEHERYRVANARARTYAAWLDACFVQRGRASEMMIELRRFYRLPLEAKLGHIARAA